MLFLKAYFLQFYVIVVIQIYLIKSGLINMVPRTFVRLVN